MTIAFDDEMVGGELLGAHGVRVRSFAAGRVCAAEGCGTVLSVYNGRSRCALHDFHDFHAELGQLARHPRAARRGALVPAARQAA